MYSWKQDCKDDQRFIENVESEILVHGEKVKKVNTEESSKMLGVHITPSLSWKSQFECMRRKLVIAMTKLLQIDLSHYQARIYYNIFMLMSVYFRSAIID